MWNVQERFTPLLLESLPKAGFSVGSTRGVMRVEKYGCPKRADRRKNFVGSALELQSLPLALNNPATTNLCMNMSETKMKRPAESAAGRCLHSLERL